MNRVAEALSAGDPAVAVGYVWHRRNVPTVHEFSYNVNQVWLDPDRPEDLFGAHRLWSPRVLRPVRFRRSDYFDGGHGPIGPAVRAELAPVLGSPPRGPIRMLTQPRTWGWLFNPITIYLAWPESDDRLDHSRADGGSPPGPAPVGAVLEVTNTPWKERHRYAVALRGAESGLRASFAKELHVSPFLDEAFDYRFAVSQSAQPAGPESHPTVGNSSVAPPLGPPVRTIDVSLDVHAAAADRDGTAPGADADQQPPVVETRLRLRLLPPDRRTMRSLVFRNPLPTHRVSLGIHWQAARLLHKRVPFVAHPGKRS